MEDQVKPLFILHFYKYCESSEYAESIKLHSLHNIGINKLIVCYSKLRSCQMWEETPVQWFQNSWKLYLSIIISCLEIWPVFIFHHNSGVQKFTCENVSILQFSALIQICLFPLQIISITICVKSWLEKWTLSIFNPRLSMWTHIVECHCI